MPRDKLTALKKPETFVDDPITAILRNGARKLLAEALEAEIELLIYQYQNLATVKVERELLEMVTSPSEKYKPGSALYPLKFPVPGIARQMRDWMLSASHLLFCLHFCERHEAWRNQSPGYT
jgi:hypothetical protein